MQHARQTIHASIAGSAQANRPGGWAYTKALGDKTVEHSGFALTETTHIQMTMVAAIQVLRGLKTKDLPVIVQTNLDMLPRGMNELMPRWLTNGWKGSDGKEVANRVLWEELKRLADEREPEAQITFVHVGASSGVAGHERAKELARKRAEWAAMDNGPGRCPASRFDPQRGEVVSVFAD